MNRTYISIRYAVHSIFMMNSTSMYNSPKNSTTVEELSDATDSLDRIINRLTL